MILWAGLVVATGGFLAFGTLRIGAGNWIGRRMPVLEIWSRFLDFLADHGASGMLIFIVTAAAVAALVIAAVALWLALALRDAPPEPAADIGGDVIAGRRIDGPTHALDLGSGVWAGGPVRRRPHGGLRAYGGGRHLGGGRSPPQYLCQCRPPLPCGASGDALARAGLRQCAALDRGSTREDTRSSFTPWRGLAGGRNRGLSLGTLPAESAHTLAIIGLFLAPGAAFAALAREDGWSPAVGLAAFVLHISLPGGWYHGGYTELVQWGLVTNVAGAVAALCMLPAIVRFLRTGGGWSGRRGGPRRLCHLLQSAIVAGSRRTRAGAWLAGAFRNNGISPRGGYRLLRQPSNIAARSGGDLGRVLAAPEL